MHLLAVARKRRIQGLFTTELRVKARSFKVNSKSSSWTRVRQQIVSVCGGEGVMGETIAQLNFSRSWNTKAVTALMDPDPLDTTRIQDIGSGSIYEIRIMFTNFSAKILSVYIVISSLKSFRVWICLHYPEPNIRIRVRGRIQALRIRDRFTNNTFDKRLSSHEQPWAYAVERDHSLALSGRRYHA